MVEQDPPLEARDRILALFSEGRLEAVEAEARSLVGEFPLSGFAWLMLGVSMQSLGKDAHAELHRAVRLLPGNADAHCNLGVAEQNRGHLEKALVRYRAAIDLDPGLTTAHFNMGVGLQSLGRLEEAIPEYRLAIGLDPQLTDAMNNLAAVYRELGRLDEAAECYRSTLAIDPVNSQANLILVAIYMDQKRLVEAEALCRRTLEIKPDFSELRQNLAKVLSYLSDFKSVVAESDRAFELQPNHAVMWEQRLYSFSYHPDLSAEDIFKEFVRWGDLFPDPGADFTSHDRNPDRRLRIGYVSPDFRRHTSRFYFWPLFANHDREAVELFAYSNVKKDDDWTREFKGQFEHWRDIRHLGDEAAAALVKEDGIDILVDLCNHMLDHRLGLFTLKPAPIQATWLGAAWTTGLKTVDYVFFDPYLAPEGTIARESIIRLPHTFLAYRAPGETADLVPPPCLKNGYTTFGYSGRTERLNHRTFRAWGQILSRLQDARLVLDFGPFGEPKTQAYYRAFLAEHGVDTSRVILRNSPNISEGLNDIDILLDSFPHSGGTMLMDAFWMGVPAVALASRPPLGRIGTSMLMNLGLAEWVASTEAEYIDKACDFARQPQVLKELRLGFRERMQQCPLMDGPGFARGFEEAYRFMFDRWVKETSPDQP